VRDPKTVLGEIAAAESPDAYLQSLHPKHEQFQRLRKALLKARRSGDAGGKPGRNVVEIERIIINMERWRWMPEDLGRLYVWNNSPEFMLYVVKDGKTIYADKTLVGAIGYATPVFSADIETIVFNPDWIAPETVLVENLLPPLRKKDYSILRNNNLKVSYNGNPVDVRKVDWRRVDIHDYTFTQAAGPKNVLGKVKFLFPNKHVVYMHDTLPVRRKFFQQSVRAIGHNCVRMEKPQQFAEVLLAEDKGWPASRVQDLWDKSINSPVMLDHKIPVHMAYFTAVVDGTGKVTTFADLYGLDNKMATALFGNATGFPSPSPESPGPQAEEADGSTLVKRTSARIAGWLQGFAGD
jgi:L,D-transpeptidase YcbB